MRWLRQRPQRGQVLLIAAVSAVAMVGIAALAIDGGRIMMDQRALQNAVDFAALSGAADLGPGIGGSSSGNAQDDAVYTVEQDLSISFSSYYNPDGHRLVSGGCGGGYACNSSSLPTPGPFNPTTAGVSPCCLSWIDSTGAYTLTVRTPYTYNGTTDPEAFISVNISHNFPLLIGGSLIPAVAVQGTAVARNYAVPYALFTFKHNDPKDMIPNGATVTVSANKRVGTNGSVNNGTGGWMTLNCNASNQYGGDLHEYVGVGAPTQTALNAASVTENGCPGPNAAKYINFSSSGYIIPPKLNLPPDPTKQSVICPAPYGAISVSSGTYLLQPTIRMDSVGGCGPRYTSVSVGTGGTLVLEPGVYYFEGSTSGSGLSISNPTSVLETGDCYLQAVPTTCANTNSAACGVSFPLASPLGGSATFNCVTPRDFGVLLVFWPAGTDVAANCSNTSSGGNFCTSGAPSGAYNSLSVASGATFYVMSSVKYHNVAVWVDQKNAVGTTLNFTKSTSLSSAGCSTTACANNIGVGSSVVGINGGGNISVLGAIFGPDDNITIGGGGSGKGYGQVLSYTVTFNGASNVAEAYNPIALAYSPVLVQ